MPSRYKSDAIVLIVGPAIMLILAFFLLEPIQYVKALVGSTSSFSDPRFSTLSSLLSMDQAVNALDDRKIMSSSIDNVNDANGTLTIVTVSNNGSFLANATYSISSYLGKSGISNFTIKDDGPQDTNKVT